MINTEKKLGMDEPISRRDFVDGVARTLSTATALSAMPALAFSAADDTAISEPVQQGPDVYPPGQTGLRGNHKGPFVISHQFAHQGITQWPVAKDQDNRVYDLVVVGAGLSGLSAAHFFRKHNPKARILLLDNHDDFGGHAKRNEFDVDGKTLLGYGGSQTLQEPSSYPDAVKEMLVDVGIDIKRFETAYDHSFYKRNGLRGGIQFSKKRWGRDVSVAIPLQMFDNYLPLADITESIEDCIEQFPVSAAAKKQLLHLFTATEDVLKGMTEDERWEYLASISYREYLEKHMAITEPDVFDVLQDLPSDSCAGIESVSAASALSYSGLPGWRTAGLPEEDDAEAYIHHFPDGNASVARSLVRHMNPDVAQGSTTDDIVMAKFDYSKLDSEAARVRLRLNSTVVKVAHEDSENIASGVRVSYVKEGLSYSLKARHCVLACYNSAIPYLCPELPQSQREALANQVKSPILYASVAVRNWKPLKKMGIGAVYSSGSYFVHTALDFPVSLGDYRHGFRPIEVRLPAFNFSKTNSTCHSVTKAQRQYKVPLGIGISNHYNPQR